MKTGLALSVNDTWPTIEEKCFLFKIKKDILHNHDSVSAPMWSKMGMIQSFMDECLCSGKV